MYMASREGWYLERVIRLVAGVMALGSAALGYFVSPLWLLLTAFVGLNLIVFSISGFCLMANILHALGIRPRCN